MDHCESCDKCSANTKLVCPKFTQQTMYILKYVSQQTEMGNIIYPYPGTWQDQPQWYILAFGKAYAQFKRIHYSNNDNK